LLNDERKIKEFSVKKGQNNKKFFCVHNIWRVP